MSDNPQFVRTDKAIVHALACLLKRKPFEKITVQDILEETPVTRATFYAHFRDKYEIAERILATFFASRKNVKEMMRTNSAASWPDLREKFPVSQDEMEILLSVRTETVDFRRTIAQELEKEYLATSTSATREIEARIYAQARIEMYYPLLRGDLDAMSVTLIDHINTQVALHLLQIPQDQEAYTYLKQRVEQGRRMG